MLSSVLGRVLALAHAFFHFLFHTDDRLSPSDVRNFSGPTAIPNTGDHCVVRLEISFPAPVNALSCQTSSDERVQQLLSSLPEVLSKLQQTH
jgi:hypothetical protein